MFRWFFYFLAIARPKIKVKQKSPRKRIKKETEPNPVVKEEVPEQTEDSILEEPVVEEPKKVKKEIVKVKEKAQSGMIELVLDMQYNAIEAIVMTLCLWSSLLAFISLHFLRTTLKMEPIFLGFWDEIQI